MFPFAPSNILYVSSIAGFTPLDNLGPYSVSKTALFGLTKVGGWGSAERCVTLAAEYTQVLAKELGPKGVRVNCLAPGIIATKFSRVVSQLAQTHYITSSPPQLYEEPDVRAQLLEHVPLKRVGEVDDMAGAAAFLCSSDASYVTGKLVEKRPPHEDCRSISFPH